ncbi:LOW QUALITY PROTEIN: chymotrypsinogen A-like [Amphiura filiformis]|uniref:LOW QUALITY PROTEIN: chymotrypsinogen A-like n=1 Tax=Amphiura filiformis TaxID=82378 RepID=UPI003B20F8E7
MDTNQFTVMSFCGFLLHLYTCYLYLFVMVDSNLFTDQLKVGDYDEIRNETTDILLENLHNESILTELGSLGEQEAKKRVVRVVGGVQSANTRWPWLVELLLTNKSRHICGGTLIGPNYVLTAAHCFDRYNTSEVTVRLGEYDRSRFEGSEMDYRIQVLTVHHRYNSLKYVGGIGKTFRSLDHDIALLKITPLETNQNEVGIIARDICPLRLPGRLDKFPDGFKCYVIGWGYTHYSNLLSDLLMPDDLRPGLPNIVHEAQIELLSRKTCRKHYYKRFTSRMLCAGQENGGRDTCDGDSGGPLVCRNSLRDGKWTLWGITSWGDNNLCNPESDKPGVYVKVSKYVRWVEKMIWKLGT